MTTLLLSYLVLGQHQTPWPPETGNNGYDQYVAAAKLVSTPEWSAIGRDRPHIAFGANLPLAYLQRESRAATGILELLKKGNSLPAFDPFKQETLATLHPEFLYFKRLSVIACDMADLNVREGHPDAAADWLLTAETFAQRSPTAETIAALVRDAMLQRLFAKALQVLPSLGREQIERQVALARVIADHPVDMVHLAKEEFEAFDASVKEMIANPDILGVRDDGVLDPTAFMGPLFKAENLSKRQGALFAKIMSQLPDPKDAPDHAVKVAIDRYSALIAPADRADYAKVLPLIEAIYQPKKVSAREIAKTLDDHGKAHVAALIHAMCDGNLKDQKAAFARPEREWGLPWKSTEDNAGDANAMVMQDGKHFQNLQADFYAMWIAQILQALGSGDQQTSDFRRHTMLCREKARLFAIHTSILSYQAQHGRLPASLAPLGNPLDPLSGKPYFYRRLSTRAYMLEALGVAGFARIDMSTKAPSRD